MNVSLKKVFQKKLTALKIERQTVDKVLFN